MGISFIIRLPQGTWQLYSKIVISVAENYISQRLHQSSSECKPYTMLSTVLGQEMRLLIID